MSRKNLNARGWANIQNVFVGIRCKFTRKDTLARSLIQLVRSAHAKSSNLFPRGLRNVECIGQLGEKISMSTLGGLLASNSFSSPRCKHTTEEHNCNYPLKCKKCACFGFDSNFACLTCDGLWEHHDVLYQTADERKMLNKAVGE